MVTQRNHRRNQPRHVAGHGGSSTAAPRPPLVEGIDERGSRYCFDPVTKETTWSPSRRTDAEGGSTWRETKDVEGRTYWFCEQTRAVSWADPHDRS